MSPRCFAHSAAEAGTFKGGGTLAAFSHAAACAGGTAGSAASTVSDAAVMMRAAATNSEKRWRKLLFMVGIPSQRCELAQSLNPSPLHAMTLNRFVSNCLLFSIATTTAIVHAED